MKRTTKKDNVVRTTPRGTMNTTVVVVPAPVRKSKPVVHGVNIYCANLDCNNRKSHRSPHQLCQDCRGLEKAIHHFSLFNRACSGDPTIEAGGPFWNFYVAPFLHDCVEKSRQKPDASYVPLYAGTE